jgi:hypothetical protein
MATNEDTVRSYDASATEYAAEAATMPEWVVRGSTHSLTRSAERVGS